MSIEGWYYLHINGDMIYKRELGGTAADIRDSDFARALWPCDVTDRAGAWRILVEGLAAGANKERIDELAHKWGADDEDALHYANYLGFVLKKDGTQCCAHRSDFKNLQESVAGFGNIYLEAMADLANKLGYTPSKMWGATFKDLVEVK